MPAAVTAVYGTSVLITSDLPTCSDTSYYCSSWNTLANGNGTTYEAGDSLVLTADVTLYAQWSQSAGISTPGGSSVVMSAATPTPQAQVSEQEADNNAGQGDDAERNDDVLQNRDGDPVYPETVYEYEYTNTAWQDQLTAIKTYTVDASGVQTLSDTQSFAYDAMGNPTSYLGKTLTWEGKQLTGVSAAGQSISYAYDENGLRTQKTVNGTTTNYYYNGSVLIGMVTGSGASAIVQRFSYDSSGSVVSVDYSTDNGSSFTTYYYLRNGQGDVVKLIDGSGNTVVQYTYDSWGKQTSCTGTLATTLGTNQPFRYRGYVYDTETGWYYLQSRYYDPGVSRFISSDVLLSTGQGVLGHNSYAYCLNNPANMSDSCGSRPNFCVSMTDGGGGSSSSTSEPTPTPTPTPYPGPGPEHKVFSSRGVNLNKVDIRIIERLIAMADAYGVDRILFTSGYRTHSKQKTLYDTYMQDPEHNNLALAPYTSWHEYGGAVDIDCPILEGLTNEDFAKFGLSRPWYDPNNSKLNETWHIQLLENSSQSTNNYDGNTYYSGITTWG